MPVRPQSHYARGHARRAKVLEATIEVIAERGIEGVTHRSVAARAEVPSSTPSYFFTSIDELIGAAITTIAEQVVTAVDELITAATAGVVDEDEFADQLVELMSDARPQLVRVQFEAYLASERRPDLQAPVQEIMRGFDAATAQALRAVGVVDADLVARQFVAVIDGFALHRIAWSRGEEDRAALTAVLRRLLDSYRGEGRAPA